MFPFFFFAICFLVFSSVVGILADAFDFDSRLRCLEQVGVCVGSRRLVV